MVYESTLSHHGVKGMKWGVRRFQDSIGSRSTSRKNRNSDDRTSEERKQSIARKRKVALKIGAAVAGTALAAYGTYKLSGLLKDKAAKKSYESGMKIADHYAQQAERYFANRIKISDINKAYAAQDRAMNTLTNTNKRTQKVQKSTVDAVKYLVNPKKYNVDSSVRIW